MSKKVNSLKNTLLLCLFFVIKKRSFWKTRWSHVIFVFKFSWNTLCCNADIWSKNVNSIKTILLAIKVNRISFLYDFSPKIPALMPIFCQKNVHSIKNTLISCPYIFQNSSILSKTMCFLVIFFKFLWKTFLLSGPYLVQKNINSVEHTLYYWPKE